MKLTAIAAVAAITLAAPAHADTDDDIDAAYLKALHSHDIIHEHGDSELIREGHNICAALRQGYSMNGITALLQLHEAHGMQDDDMKFLVKVSAASYCPEYIQ